MKRFAALLVTLSLLLLFLPPAALAQTVSCPTGGFSLFLPDHFSEQSYSASDDPDLCFYWKGSKLTVQGYASYLGEIAGSDLFQVLTGNETYADIVTRNGMSMLCAAGADASGAYTMYSWMDRGNNVTLWFYYPAGDRSCTDTIEKIMNSISFDAGH